MGRFDAASFTIGNLAYLGTGSCKNRFCYYSDFWSYNTSTDTWTQLANYPGGNTSAAVGFAIGNDGYLGGGGKPFSLVLSTAFYKYTVSTNSWAAIASIPSPGVMASSSFVKNNEGYVGCGITNNSATVLLNDYKKYDPSSNSWTSLTSNSNYSKSLSPNITQINDSVIYSIGGMGKRGELTNVWRLKTSSTPCTHYDTIYVAVQDTLTFKINIASVAQPQFVGVKVYPNPAGSQVTIAISDFTQLSNYTLKIYNTLGVEVFSQAVTAATYTINTSTIGVAGTYHLEVYDSLNAKRGRKTIIIQ
ncbi:MAG TPA: hypothetical protein DCY51_10250 [Bacteroidetes bacterium]|nr:hypothetical protein [Bacteroidota bacterium]